MLMKNKRGISVILGYVLLVALGISLATIVFIWLRDYVTPNDTGKCSEDVSLIIEKVDCDYSNKILSITLRNRGLFSINGSIIRVNDNPASDLGLYTIGVDKKGLLKNDGANFTSPLKPNEEIILEYDFNTASSKTGVNLFFLVDAQPFVIDNGKVIYCERVSNVDVNCNLGAD